MKPALFTPLFVVLLALPAAAQESGQVGLVTGYPANIGVIWHVADTVAIRPDFSFSRTTSESKNSPTESSSSSVAFGVSALWYVGQIRDNVRTYVTPRFAYQRIGNETSSGTLSSEGHGNAYTYSGAFGVQYSPARRFSIFGEAGVVYSTQETTFESPGFILTTPTTIVGKSSGSAFSTRAAVGVILYFN